MLSVDCSVLECSICNGDWGVQSVETGVSRVECKVKSAECIIMRRYAECSVGSLECTMRTQK